MRQLVVSEDLARRLYNTFRIEAENGKDHQQDHLFLDVWSFLANPFDAGCGGWASKLYGGRVGKWPEFEEWWEIVSEEVEDECIRDPY